MKNKPKVDKPDTNGWLSKFPSGFEQLSEVGENRVKENTKQVIQPLSLQFDSGRTHIQTTDPPVFQRVLTKLKKIQLRS